MFHVRVPHLHPIAIAEPFIPPEPKRRRVSAFKEIGIGLDGQHDEVNTTSAFQKGRRSDESAITSFTTETSPSGSSKAGFGLREAVLDRRHKHGLSWLTWSKADLPSTRWSKAEKNSSSPPAAVPSMSHIVFIGILLTLVIPGLHQSTSFGRARYLGSGANAAVVQLRSSDLGSSSLKARVTSPTDICTRWSHQAAVLNGTLFVYGGQAKTNAQQKTNTWNWHTNLQRSFNAIRSSRRRKWISLEFLQLPFHLRWLILKPVTSPLPFSLWEYENGVSQWKEHKSPQTSTGNNSEPDNIPIQRAAEGAGLSVPELGRGFYFGGHLDGYTTPGWSQSIERVYLKSLLEYTYPGRRNEDVKSLSGGRTVGPDGIFRNITQGGVQEAAGFTERADGNLIYIPGFAPQGVILGLAGGTNTTFTEMNIIDVYDIANSTWYKQATSGETPKIRVNACAVVAVAPDGSSFNVHMYGGQNLMPYGSQIQYDDMWILTIPSFTWIKVSTAGQSNPPARAGHTCNVWDGQMVVVGGYVGQDIGCDSPGVYVFDMSRLKWQTQFTALTGSNERNQQPAQQKGSQNANNGYQGLAGLDGSFGYTVPPLVQSVIGGSENGGATVTAPIESAILGPIATGKVPTYTVTAGGSVVTTTGAARPGQAGSSAPQKFGPNIGAIVAGVIAGLFAILAGYLGLCAWVYRRQLTLYKKHVVMSQRQATGDLSMPEKAGMLGLSPRSSPGSDSDQARWATDQSSSGPSGDAPSSYAPVGRSGAGGNTSTANSSTDDLMAGQEPSFLGVMLNPRRSLRVINRD